MSVLFYSILGVLAVSLLSFVGAIGLFFKENILNKLVVLLVAFATGGLMGGALFHLLPESLEMTDDSIRIFVYLIIGFCLFFILERILRWHHCHDDACDTHEHLGWMNLVGDGVHNLIDGMVVFAAFAGGVHLGIPVLLSIILHEIPQELGDFGILIYSGFSKWRALMYNFISALLSLVGVAIAYFLVGFNQSIEIFLLPFAAGGFIYIAASDLIPELHKEKKVSKSILSFLIFVLALILMWAMKVLFE